MKEVIIKAGAYGLRTSTGRVRPVTKGERAEVSDEEAARLVKIGAADYAEAAALSPKTAQDGPEASGPSSDIPESESDGEPPENGGDAAPEPSEEIERLARLSKADLARMAEDAGVDISQAKNNRERAALIVSAETREGEMPAEQTDGDIVT